MSESRGTGKYERVLARCKDIPPITAAVAKVSPSVVTVQTEVQSQAPQDPFDVFFGRSRTQTQAGLGTGFVVRKDGVIVTNAHVVAGAQKVSVMMRDGKVYPAKVLGLAPPG